MELSFFVQEVQGVPLPFCEKVTPMYSRADIWSELLKERYVDVRSY